MMNEFTKLELRKLSNTRDLGGIATKDGKKIKQGVLFRSGTLYKLPKNTVRELENLGIRTVIDLRTERERIEKPDVVLKNCTYENCSLVCTATPGITYENKMRKVMKEEGMTLSERYGTGDNYMVEMYKYMVTEQSSLDALKRFFRILLSSDGGVLFHCNSGKDRVGICAMLLEKLLGVDDTVILKDYMASRGFCRMKFFWYKVGLSIVPVTMKFKKFLFCLMRTKELYLNEAIKYLEQKYGSVLEFCEKVLGITETEVGTLKAKYLE